MNDETFEVLYPLIEVGSVPGPTAANEPIYVRRAFSSGPNGLRYTWIISKPDKTFIKMPGCILCDYGNSLSEEDLKNVTQTEILANLNRVHKLQKNSMLTNQWLYKPGEPMESDAIALPDRSIDPLYVKGDRGLAYFYEFVLFTIEASLQGTGSATSNGQSEGRKTSPLVSSGASFPASIAITQ
jgi:hypothetical protein